MMAARAICEGRAMEASVRSVGELCAKELGRKGEDICVIYLEKNGFEVMERNWRCPQGEIDVVCRDPVGTVALVEVKTRLDLANQGVYPEVRIDDAKRERYGVLARLYLAQHPAVGEVRFDAVGISIVANNLAHVRHVSGAWVCDR